MLQSMRDNLKGTVAFIVVLFLGLIMALGFVDWNTAGSSRNFDEVAKVEGRTITERELQLALQQERQRLQQQFGSSLPADFLSDDRLRAPVVQGLVERTVLLDTAVEGKMTASPAELDKIILELPDFQQDGKFDPNTFVQRVRMIGHTPASFRALVRDDVVVNQLRNGLTATAFMTETEIANIVALSQQTRDFSWVVLPIADLPKQMVVTDDEITDYYDANKQNYTTTEKVSVEYIELKVSDIASNITISEEELQAQYQQELQSFQASTQREAAHIMIEGDDEAAKKKIAEVQQKLAAGEDFAELAKTYSDDFGSKENGGNLGLSSGDAFPEAFEAALKTLSIGSISEPVTIDGATHFIKLVSIDEQQAPSFEEARVAIEATLKKLQAEERFVEKLTALKDLAYNAENLEEVGDQLQLPVEKTGLFTRSGGNEPVLSDFRVVEAAFSEQVLQQGFTSEVLELAPDHAVVLNLLQHEPVRTLTLDEKREAIVAELQQKKAQESLAEEADTLKAKLDEGESLSVLAEEKQLTVQNQQAATRDQAQLNGQLLQAIFAMPRPADRPVSTTVFVPGEGYAVVSLTSVNDGNYQEMSDEERRGARLSLARTAAADEFRAWQSVRVNQADVDISGGNTLDQ